MKKLDFNISVLGKPMVKMPLLPSQKKDEHQSSYVSDDRYIIYDIETTKDARVPNINHNNLLELAGPRDVIYFDPAKVRAGIVTCGGLCPGLNDVIRAIVMTLWYRYDSKHIYGFRCGYRGLIPRFKLPIMELTPDIVSKIHRLGGTILGASRGYGDCTDEIVDSLERMNISMLFAIGGDGAQRGALAISEEAKRRGLKIAVVGIPKTIDNDLSFVQKSFGFQIIFL